MQTLTEWVVEHQAELIWAGLLSLLMFVASAVILPLLVVRMRADYFLHDRPPADTFRGRHLAIRIAGQLLKNLIGLCLIVAGLTMMIGPGQGVLTILFGLMLLDIPGKWRFELWLVRKQPVLRSINWIRARAGKLPLRLPPDDGFMEESESVGGEQERSRQTTSKPPVPVTESRDSTGRPSLR